MQSKTYKVDSSCRSNDEFSAWLKDSSVSAAKAVDRSCRGGCSVRALTAIGLFHVVVVDREFYELNRRMRPTVPAVSLVNAYPI